MNEVRIILLYLRINVFKNKPQIYNNYKIYKKLSQGLFNVYVNNNCYNI